MSDKPSSSDAPAPGPVKIQKASERKVVEGRVKACAECGRNFTLQEGEKFFLCPRCYTNSFQKKKRPGEAQILTRITCSACGAEEYLTFVPTDPGEALCKACFQAKRRERRPDSHHPKRKPESK